MSQTLHAGEVFEGKYRIAGKVGEGGFASVYLAKHVDLGHRVAIKLLQREKGEARFLREGRILASLKSPYTVRVLDFGRTEGGASYLVSEFVDGAPLSHVIARGPMRWSDTEPILRQVLMSLSEAHEAGIVHRDLKPANVMQLPDGSIRVLDFGIAKVQTENLTTSGAIIGTIRYMAPECLLGADTATPAADVFAVGLLAQALLTGARPFEGLEPQRIVEVLYSDVPLTLPPTIDVPKAVHTWILGLLTKDPFSRPSTADAALAGLDAALAREELAPPDEKLNAGAGARAVVVLVGVFVAVLGGGVVWLNHQKAAKPGPPEQLAVAPAELAEPAEEAPVKQAPEVSIEFLAGVDHYEKQDWIGAIRQFHEVEQAPTTYERQVLAEKDYVRKAINQVLDQEQTPETIEDLRTIMILYPDDGPTRARLGQIKRKQASKNRNKVDPVQAAPRRMLSPPRGADRMPSIEEMRRAEREAERR